MLGNRSDSSGLTTVVTGEIMTMDQNGSPVSSGPWANQMKKAKPAVNPKLGTKSAARTGSAELSLALAGLKPKSASSENLLDTSAPKTGEQLFKHRQQSHGLSPTRSPNVAPKLGKGAVNASSGGNFPMRKIDIEKEILGKCDSGVKVSGVTVGGSDSPRLKPCGKVSSPVQTTTGSVDSSLASPKNKYVPHFERSGSSSPVINPKLGVIKPNKVVSPTRDENSNTVVSPPRTNSPLVASSPTGQISRLRAQFDSPSSSPNIPRKPIKAFPVDPPKPSLPPLVSPKSSNSPKALPKAEPRLIPKTPDKVCADSVGLKDIEEKLCVMGRADLSGVTDTYSDSGRGSSVDPTEQLDDGYTHLEEEVEGPASALRLDGEINHPSSGLPPTQRHSAENGASNSPPSSASIFRHSSNPERSSTVPPTPQPRKVSVGEDRYSVDSCNYEIIEGWFPHGEAPNGSPMTSEPCEPAPPPSMSPPALPKPPHNVGGAERLPELPEKRRSRGNSVSLLQTVPLPRPLPPDVPPGIESGGSSGRVTPVLDPPPIPYKKSPNTDSLLRGVQTTLLTVKEPPPPPKPALPDLATLENLDFDDLSDMPKEPPPLPPKLDSGQNSKSPSGVVSGEISPSPPPLPPSNRRSIQLDLLPGGDPDAPPLPPRSPHMGRSGSSVSLCASLPRTKCKKVDGATAIDPSVVVPAPRPKKSIIVDLPARAVPDGAASSGGSLHLQVPSPAPKAVNPSPPLGYLKMSTMEKKANNNSSTGQQRRKSTPEPFKDLLGVHAVLSQPPTPSATTSPPDYLVLVDDDVTSECSDDNYSSVFDDEPLYQHYNADIVAREIVHQTGEGKSDDEDDDYMYMPAESVQNYVSDILSNRESMSRRESTAIDASDEVMTEDIYQIPSVLDDIVAKVGVGGRKLWGDMAEVQASGILQYIKPEEKKMQETLFELITSEASYLKSLQLLISHFVACPQLNPDNMQQTVICKRDHHILFSNIQAVRDVSQRFLKKSEHLWVRNHVLNPEEICSIITDYCTRRFDVYVKYVSNQMFQERKLKELRDSNREFTDVLGCLELDDVTRGLTLQSFLALPMQRITRLPLLVDSIGHRMESSASGYASITHCLNTLQKLVRQCNEKARQMENIEQVNEIDRVLEFKHGKKIPVVSQSRSLVKKGQLTRVFHQSSGLLDKLRRKETLHMFLFNDLFIITKKKGETYQVIDHAPRIHVHADVITDQNIGRWLPSGAPSGCHNLFYMVLMEKKVELVLSCESTSERTRWVEAVTPTQQLSEEETIYEDWDCPQVQAIHKYVAQEPDELSMEESDIIHVSRKMADGWYEGERIRDGEKGWFPSNFTVEIQSSHQRAKNLRQQTRMMFNKDAGRR